MSPDELEKVRELSNQPAAAKPISYERAVKSLLDHISNLERINRALGEVVERQKVSCATCERDMTDEPILCSCCHSGAGT